VGLRPERLNQIQLGFGEVLPSPDDDPALLVPPDHHRPAQVDPDLEVDLDSGSSACHDPERERADPDECAPVGSRPVSVAVDDRRPEITAHAVWYPAGLNTLSARSPRWRFMW
jgi:hypothetical protein